MIDSDRIQFVNYSSFIFTPSHEIIHSYGASQMDWLFSLFEN